MSFLSIFFYTCFLCPLILYYNFGYAKKEKRICTMRKIRHFIYIVMLALLVAIFPANISYAKERVIRVGYDQNSHFIQEKNGEYYGYGVEYLNKISEYTNWTYEFVTVDSWSDTFQKLRENEIDLICTAHYTTLRNTHRNSYTPIFLLVTKQHCYIHIQIVVSVIRTMMFYRTAK